MKIKKFIYAVFILIIVFTVTDLISDSPENYFNKIKVENIGFPINSIGDDFSPSITADGKIMIFSSKLPSERTHNIYICFYKKGRWTNPQYFSEINEKFANDESPYITPKGDLILFCSDREESTMEKDQYGYKKITYDIYSIRVIDGRWSRPAKLQGDVNTIQNERSPSLSRDQKTLYFTRWPFKNIKKSKILQAKYQKGKCTEILTLPEPINTGNYDIAIKPALKENRLYFSSRRPGGYGGWDIYYVDFINGKYQKAINLGSGINSQGNEFSFTESIAGVYLSSNRSGSKGLYDIYSSFNPKRLPENIITDKVIEPKVSTRIKFKIINKNNYSPILTHIKLSLKDSNNPEREPLRNIIRKTDEKGIFVLVPRTDVKWITLYINKNEYSPVKKTFEVKTNESTNFLIELESNIPEVKIVKTEKNDIEKRYEKAFENYNRDNLKQNKSPHYNDLPKILFQPIFFSYNSYNIRLQYIPQLHKILNYLREHRNIKLEITGHSDLHGTNRTNLNIGYKRARTVRNYFRRLGLRKNRFFIKSMGNKEPAVKSWDKKYGEMNRRVEFKIYQ